MVTAAQNELLTRVEGDAPMGQFMRRHWIPCALSASLVPDGAPQHVRLLGEDFVAFRATDGRVGFLDERCPHRGASLLLAHNADCALTCVFHAWKIDVSGKVVDVPSEGERSERFAAHVKVGHYPTFEGGGLLWVFLGEGAPPPRPALPFLDLPEDHYFITRSIAPCNWLQGVEGTIDSVHVGTLHMTWIAERTSLPGETITQTLASHPTYECEDASYGMRAAALRAAGPNTYVRTTEYVMPFVSLVPGGGGELRGTSFISVPRDDVSHMLFWGNWDEELPGTTQSVRDWACKEDRDENNYALVGGDKSAVWGQDRAAMARGHFTGFTGCLLDEDMVVQASMGAIADRTREQLCASDVGVVRLRRRLLAAVAGEEQSNVGEGCIVRPLDEVLPAGVDWRSIGGTAAPRQEPVRREPATAAE